MKQTDKEYAEALFMVIENQQDIAVYLDSLGIIKNLISENPEYTDFLASPAIPVAERLQAIDEAFASSMPEYIISFLKILCENGKIRSLPQCIDEFGKIAMAVSNRTTADIYSAVPLSDEQKKAVCEKLEKVTGKTIEPVYTVDNSLIGGIKIEVEGKTFDGSIRNRLQNVKDVIKG